MGPRVDLADLGTTKILPTRIRNLDHPAHGIDAMLTMLTKLQLGTGRDGPALADLPPPERNPVPTTQEVRWAPGPVSNGRENLLPTPGFKSRLSSL